MIPTNGSCKLFDRKFAVDRLDIEPELGDAKFGRRNLLRHLLWFQQRIFCAANLSFTCNESTTRDEAFAPR